MTDNELEKHLKLLHTMQLNKKVFMSQGNRLVAAVPVEGCTKTIDIINEMEEIEAEIPIREYDLFKKIHMWNSYGHSLGKKSAHYTNREKEQSETFKMSAHEAQEKLRLLNAYQEFLQRKLIEYRVKQFRGMALPLLPVEKPHAAGTRDYYIEKCRVECQQLHLPERQTISLEIKFKIAETIGIKNLGSFKDFKSRKSNAYQYISTMLSELGYTKKRAKK